MQLIDIARLRFEKKKRQAPSVNHKRSRAVAAGGRKCHLLISFSRNKASENPLNLWFTRSDQKKREKSRRDSFVKSVGWLYL